MRPVVRWSRCVQSASRSVKACCLRARCSRIDDSSSTWRRRIASISSSHWLVTSASRSALLDYRHHHHHHHHHQQQQQKLTLKSLADNSGAASESAGVPRSPGFAPESESLIWSRLRLRGPGSGGSRTCKRGEGPRSSAAKKFSGERAMILNLKLSNSSHSERHFLQFSYLLYSTSKKTLPLAANGDP